jgi:hypothetical protein
LSEIKEYLKGKISDALGEKEWILTKECKSHAKRL